MFCHQNHLCVRVSDGRRRVCVCVCVCELNAPITRNLLASIVLHHYVLRVKQNCLFSLSPLGSGAVCAVVERKRKQIYFTQTRTEYYSMNIKMKSKALVWHEVMVN